MLPVSFPVGGVQTFYRIGRINDSSTIKESWKIGGMASQSRFQRFVAFGYFLDRFFPQRDSDFRGPVLRLARYELKFLPRNEARSSWNQSIMQIG